MIFQVDTNGVSKEKLAKLEELAPRDAYVKLLVQL